MAASRVSLTFIVALSVFLSPSVKSCTHKHILSPSLSL